MSTKALIKTARACINSGKWEEAVSTTRKVLSFEPQNHDALIFQGYALFHLKSFEESEESYKNVLSLGQNYAKQPRPWQGLLKIYEAQKNVPEYIKTAIQLSELFKDGEDHTKCLNEINKLISFVQDNGTNEQYKLVIGFVLPGSQLFNYLGDSISGLAGLYLRLAEIIEREEKEKINNEIAKRRSRLTATIGNVTLEVKNEVLSASPLEKLYQNILDWSGSDDGELRRDIESRLLQHSYDKLLVLPADKKSEQLSKVQKWAKDMVILRHPFELAWRIFIEWKDCESLSEHDVNDLRQYVNFFPNTGLGKVLNSYLESEISPFPLSDIENQEGGVSLEAGEIDPLQILSAMSEGLEKASNSALCHQLTSEYYLFVKDYESSVNTCRAGKKLLLAQFQETGISLPKNLYAVTATLATALIHYQSPKYHEEARTYFDTIISKNETNIPALVGIGFILEEQQNYERALTYFTKALEYCPGSIKILSEASWCRVLMGDYLEGRKGLEECLQEMTGEDAQTREVKAQVLWRIGTCMWMSNEESRHDRSGPYSYFMKALQINRLYAPAYTSMGIYYADITNDVARATKCFERAFELSSEEVEAAERLAGVFADTQEWGYVEIIARRVAEADKIRSVPGKGKSWPQNAIGVVELNAQNYAQAVVAFQSAIRSTPSDFHSWVGLGEAYTKSGRYIAAIKAFQQATHLDENNWFLKYMIANVHRELGEFDKACLGYQGVLSVRPEEFAILMALAECLFAMAHSFIEKAYYGQAADALVKSLETSKKVVTSQAETFNLWKNIGDVCLLFSWIQAFTSQFPAELVKEMVVSHIDKRHLDIMSEYDNVDSSTLESLQGEDGTVRSCIHLGIISYKRALFVSADDRNAHAVAWFNLGCAEFRAYICRVSQRDAHRGSAIRCFKRAIKIEPGNHEFWNALGVATAELSPRASQHALVRSLYINENSSKVWTNLGILYLLQKDVELASKAFTRAQSMDPEYVYSWVGQGLVSVILGEFETAQELFEHAFEISDGFAIFAKREYAVAKFDTIRTQSESSFISLVGPIFAVHKFEQQLVNQPALLHLNALLHERIGAFDKATVCLSTVCEIYEQRYEESEADGDLARYVQSKADLARMRLGQKEYNEAIENALMALDLSTDIEELQFCRLSAHLTCGLAYYYAGQMGEALEMFKAALKESSENPDVITLLAQVLWAKGGDDEREVAREQLFLCIENHPDHLASLLLLGSIGVIDQSEDILEAVMHDLYTVRGSEIESIVKDKIDMLLNIVVKSQVKKDPVPVATCAVFLRPAHPRPWQNLAEVADDQSAADMAKRVAERGVFSAEVVADALAGVGQISCDQRAIMIAPWRANGWSALAADVAIAVST